MALKFQRWKLSGELSPNQYDDNSCIVTITGLPSGWSWELFLNHGESLDVIALDLDESGTVAQTILKKEQLAFSGLYTIQLRGKKGEITQHTNKLGFTVGDSFSESAHWPEIPDAFNKYVQSVADNLKESLEGNIDVSTAVEKYLEENPVTFTESDPTVPAWAKEKNPPTYSASEVGAIPAPSAANVGQTIVVSAVDDTGAPTAWEPADLPTGGGGIYGLLEQYDMFELAYGVLDSTDLPARVVITEDSGGNAFDVDGIIVWTDIKSNVSYTGIAFNNRATVANPGGHSYHYGLSHGIGTVFNLYLCGANNTFLQLVADGALRLYKKQVKADDGLEFFPATQIQDVPSSITAICLCSQYAIKSGTFYKVWGLKKKNV